MYWYYCMDCVDTAKQWCSNLYARVLFYAESSVVKSWGAFKRVLCDERVLLLPFVWLSDEWLFSNETLIWCDWLSDSAKLILIYVYLKLKVVVRSQPVLLFDTTVFVYHVMIEHLIVPTLLLGRLHLCLSATTYGGGGTTAQGVALVVVYVDDLFSSRFHRFCFYYLLNFTSITARSVVYSNELTLFWIYIILLVLRSSYLIKLPRGWQSLLIINSCHHGSLAEKLFFFEEFSFVKLIKNKLIIINNREKVERASQCINHLKSLFY